MEEDKYSYHVPFVGVSQARSHIQPLNYVPFLGIPMMQTTYANRDEIEEYTYLRNCTPQIPPPYDIAFRTPYDQRSLRQYCRC